jgi:hypothetical protein
MYELNFKIPLIAWFDRDIAKPTLSNHYSTHEVNIEDLKFNDINIKDIENLDGQYDWIKAWRYREYDRKMGGFNSNDVLMSVTYDKGNYIVMLLSEKPFDTIVKNNHYYSLNGPWEDITLKEAIIRFLEGCISDGIGENSIGTITYHNENAEIWLGNLIEM